MKKKKINNLFRRFIFSIFGFLVGLVLLLAGFLIAICNFPEKIWFLGLAFSLFGLILTLPSAHSYIGIADKETSKLIRNFKKKIGR